MEISPFAVLTAVAGFALGMWLWYALSWRWYPGLPVLGAGAVLAGFTGGLCFLSEALSFAVLCDNYSVAGSAGLSAGTALAGVVILVVSPVVAFWRRALEVSRHEA